MKKTRILIVEDESIVALDIKRHLLKEGYDVAGIFTTGEDALRHFQSTGADLVLMDIMLQGGMDGIQTAERLKAEYNVPVIFLTAFADDATIERVKFIEPFGYIIKPFTERELRTAIEMGLYKHQISLELIRSEEKYRSFFEDDLSGTFVTDGDGRITDCNTAFMNIFGLSSREEAKQINFNNLLKDEGVRKRFWTQVKEKEKLNLTELWCVNVKGDTRQILANIVGSINGDEIQELKGYLIDVTDRKKLEDQLRQSQKLEAIGRLAGGIAHDFNNILTVIMGYTAMIQEKLKEGSDVEPDITGIQNASRRASNLTRQLLAFSRRQELKPEMVDLNHLIQEMEKMIRRLITDDIGMQLLLDADDPYIFVDPGQIEQVLINLSVNARDAMHRGGNLVIQTRNIQSPEGENGVDGKIPMGDYVVLSVIDTGIGIDEQIRPMIFEPFFTTKPEGEGTGLGLATVYGIVEQSGGFIQVSSKHNEGTAFHLLFPQQQKTVKQVVKEILAEGSFAGNETILLVEDDENVRNMISKILLRYGYNVLEASNAGEALLIWEKETIPIDLLITDIIMPHLSGDKLAERMLKKEPDLKVLQMSGYPVSTIKDRGFSVKEDVFVQKPFSPFKFIAKIRDVLDHS